MLAAVGIAMNPERVFDWASAISAKAAQVAEEQIPQIVQNLFDLG